MSSAIIEKAISRARIAFSQNITKDVKFRKTQLKALVRLLDEKRDDLTNALKTDLRKPFFEGVVTEIEFTRNEAMDHIYNIEEYMKPKKVSKPFAVMLDDAFIHYEPFGLVLIMGAWNYPVQLLLAPLIGAISAGNCAILKPSEIAPATSDLIAKLIPQYLDKDCFQVITGGPEECKTLLEEKFDYIFYTGSTHVGKIIQQSAAKHMTPTTLECGGKSPLYIDDTVPNMEIAWRRILWGKLINAGQTCVAPDYVLCTENVQKSLIENASKIIGEFYGKDPQKSPDFCRMINDKHFQRVSKLIQSSGKPIIGGNSDVNEKYIAPTVLINVKPEDPIMQEEIFGPVLPIVTVKDVQHAIDFINRREKPLSLYLFTSKRDIINRFLTETSSGSVCANDTVFHLCVDTLPFGGVGESGMGAYHGRSSFELFSHPKSVLVRDYNGVLEALGSKRYPPYKSSNMSFLLQLMKKRKNMLPNNMFPYFMFSVGFITACLFTYMDVLSFSK